MVRIASRSGLLAAASLVSLGFASSASANPGFGLIGDLVIQKPAPKPTPTQGPEDTKAAEPAKDAAKDGENYRLSSADKAKPDTSASAPAAAPAPASDSDSTDFDLTQVDPVDTAGLGPKAPPSAAVDSAAPDTGASVGSVPPAPVVAAAPIVQLTPTSSLIGNNMGTVDVPSVVVREGFNPNQPPPTGILDPVNITGVGQVVTNAGGGSVGTCTGTLINPRTVIFAAHCVNTRAASAYGSATGGTAISVGFQQNNLGPLRRWLGLDGAPAPFLTDTARAIYNVENVWYDVRSLDGGFIQADVAIATLDTPAFDIPTWAMLFTPLDGQEHVTVTGYGSTGVGTQGSAVSGGFRRRVAENYVSFLGSLNDRNEFLFGSRSSYEQNHYMSAFNDPNPNYNTGAGKYDFGLFGANDTALPVEGITGPGDSGGPLILDQKFSEKVILGVLSGGSRFFAAQPFGSYGSHSFYQPLSSFWDVIVANNPYVYATNKTGNGDWTDASHWVQMMDPSYKIVVDGKLVNGVPSRPGDGITGTGAKFGDICFLTDCRDFTDPGESMVDGDPFFVEGGPGSTNFVPNNVTANPTQGVRPRYYDVTLSARGTTTLSNASVVIDTLTMDGITRLTVAETGSLRVLGDYTQAMGWTDINGTLRANEMFVMTGILSGSGTIQTPFLTTASAQISPGGNGVGKLTVDGNFIIGSGSTLFIDASNKGADSLAVTGMLSLSDPTDPASKGPRLSFSVTGAMNSPRFGQTFTLATAQGGIGGTFGEIQTFTGLLRPKLTYGPNEITMTIDAARITDIILGKNPNAQAFGAALDTLRSTSYDALYNLYGMIDVMGVDALTATLAGMGPQLDLTNQSLQQRQSRLLSNQVSDRLSLLGGGMSGADSGRMSVVGASDTSRSGLAALDGQRNVRMGISDLAPTGSGATMLPEGFSGFVAGGVYGAAQSGAANLSDGSYTGSYFSLGLERAVSPQASFGVAMGYTDGRELSGTGMAEAKTTQVAAYGAYRLGGNAYVGGMASLDTVDLDTQRSGFDGLVDRRLNGATGMTRYAASAEIGMNLAVSEGITLTPRAQLGYERMALGGYREQGSETALAIDDLSIESVTARTGFTLAGSHTAFGGGWTLIPQLKADYVRRVAGGNDGMTVRFAAADHVAIALPLANGDESWGELRGGVTLQRGNLTFGAGFETAIEREGLEDNRAMAEFGIRF